MANITETLRIIIDADSKGAERAFGKIGDDATKHVGKAETRVQKLSSKATSAGIAMAMAGAVGAAGFYKLAKSSEEAETQNRKLTNSIANSKKEFSGSGQKLRDLAAALQKKTAADADAIVSGQALLVQFGLSESQIMKLTPLVVDLSRKMGVDLDAASKAVGKAVSGNTGALGKMGVQIDKTKAKVDPFTATLEAVRGAAGGFAEQEGKTFTGQIEILKNNLGDLGETVGKGAAGVFSDLAGGAISLVGGLNNLNPALGESVGRVGTIGSLALTAVGGLTFIAGQFVKVKDAAINSAGSLTKFGKAAAVIGGLAAAFAIYQIADALDSAVLSTERYQNAARKLADAQGPVAAVKALKDLASQSDSVVDKFLRLGNYLGTGVRQADATVVDIEGVEFSVSKLKGALNDLAESGDAQALAAALKLIEGGAKGSQNSLDLVGGTVERYKQKLADLTGGQALATVAQREQSAAVAEAVTTYDDQEATLEGITASLKAYEAELKSTSDLYAVADTAAAAFGKSLEQSSRLDDSVASVGELRTGIQGLGADLQGIPATVGVALDPFADIGEKGQTAISALVSFGEQASTYLQQLIAQGSESIVPGVAGKLREQLVQALKAAGVPPGEIEKYLGLAGLRPIDIEAALRVSNVEKELAKTRLTLALFDAELKAAPKEVRVKINQALISGDVATANRLIAGVVSGRTVTVRVKPQFDPQWGKFGVAGGLPGPPAPRGKNPDGKPKKATGGMVKGYQPYIVNEAGPEMFVPTTNGFVMNHDDSTRLVAGVEKMLAGGGGTSVVYNVNVAAGISDPSETGRRVVDAIRSYERNNGTGWRN